MGNNFILSILTKQTDRLKKNLISLTAMSLVCILAPVLFSLFSNDIDKVAQFYFLGFIVAFMMLVIDIVFFFIYLGKVKKCRNYTLLNAYSNTPLETLVPKINAEYDAGKLIDQINLGSKTAENTLYLLPSYIIQENLGAFAVDLTIVTGISIFQETTSSQILAGNKMKTITDTWNIVRLWMDQEKYDFYFKKQALQAATQFYNTLLLTYKLPIKIYNPEEK